MRGRVARFTLELAAKIRAISKARLLCHLTHTARARQDQLTRAGEIVTADERKKLLNGIERLRPDGNENGIYQALGERLCFTLDAPAHIGALRLRFDPDFDRASIGIHPSLRKFAQKLHTGKDFVPVKVPATIVKSFSVYADGQKIADVEDNFHSLVTLSLDVVAREIAIAWHATNGAEQVHLFAAHILP